MAKKTFTLEPQQELGTRIDQNLAKADQTPVPSVDAPRPLSTPQPSDLSLQTSDLSPQPSALRPQPSLLPSQQKGRETRTMVKQLWLDEEIYNRCVQAQADRKQAKLPSSFDALAYDAIVAYLNQIDHQSPFSSVAIP